MIWLELFRLLIDERISHILFMQWKISKFEFYAEESNTETQSKTSDAENVIAVEAPPTTTNDGPLNYNTGYSFAPKSSRKKPPNTAIRIKKKNIHNVATTSTVTPAITAFTSMLWDDIVNYSPKKDGPGDLVIKRKKVECAEKMIRGAFVELYRGLGLLKNYRLCLGSVILIWPL